MSELVWSVNPFGGAVVDPKSVSGRTGEFATDLSSAIKRWHEENLKVAWLEIPKASFSAIAIASEQGFEFHHDTEEYAMMTIHV